MEVEGEHVGDYIAELEWENSRLSQENERLKSMLRHPSVGLQVAQNAEWGKQL